jgi:hypothetical protein
MANRISIDQLEVTTFDPMPASFELVAAEPYTPPVPNCYSPLCIPTELPEQCPKETTVQTEAGGA